LSLVLHQVQSKKQNPSLGDTH